MQRRTVLTASSVGVAMLVVAAFLGVAAASPSNASDDEVTRAPNTADVVSAPLESSIRTTGKVGFTDGGDVVAGIGGTVTWLPEEGSTVRPGEAMYRVDNLPVVLLPGALPQWRDFGSGMGDGPDVQQLEQALADLGFFHGTVDQKFTGKTADGIRAWQKAHGLPRDGVIPMGRILFHAGEYRVGERKAEVGAQVGPGTALYARSSSTPVVTADAPAAERGWLAEGVKAELGLPGGGTATGTITAVGTPVERQGSDGSTSLVIPLTISPDDPAALAGFVPLTVQVSLLHSGEEDVLQVPVTALVPLNDTDFAVEVYRKGTVTRVPVTTGAFVGGLVEITDGDVKAGDKVVVPE